MLELDMMGVILGAPQKMLHPFCDLSGCASRHSCVPPLSYTCKAVLGLGLLDPARSSA